MKKIENVINVNSKKIKKVFIKTMIVKSKKDEMKNKIHKEISQIFH